MRIMRLQVVWIYFMSRVHLLVVMAPVVRYYIIVAAQTSDYALESDTMSSESLADDLF